jgi:MFS superfamily sulfate permease-like transporter
MTKKTQMKESVTVVNPQHWDKPFWRGVVSSEFGVGSTSRISTLAIISTTLGILIYLTWRNDRIPDNLIQLAWFSALLITTVYSPAKIAEIFKNFKK